MPGITLDDSHLAKRVFSPVCIKCQNLNIKPGADPPTCKAFPNGIPEAIWNGDNDHTRPYPGDNGIQFKQRTTAPA